MRRRKQHDSDGRHAIPSLLGSRIPMTALIQTLAVAEYLSFHRAAQGLGTSQSSVSERIKALEIDLGIVLFDRNTLGVRLTAAGRRFVDQVDEAVGIIDKAIVTAGMQAGAKKVDYTSAFTLLWLAVFSTGCFMFHEKYPNIQLDISEGTARDAQLMVRECKLDVAFMVGAYDTPDLNSRMIWRDRLMVVMPAMHSLAGKSEIEWQQLAEETFLVRHGGTGSQVYDLIVARTAGKWITPTIQRVDVERTTLMLMIAAGYGISLFVEESTVSATANVAFLPIRDESQVIPFSAVWSPNNRDPNLNKLITMADKPDLFAP